MLNLDGVRWWTFASYLLWRRQGNGARRAQVGLVVLLLVAVPALMLVPMVRIAHRGTVASTRIEAPLALAADPTPSPTDSPSPVPVAAPLYAGDRTRGTLAVSRQYGCPSVSAPPALPAGWAYPRIVIPRVGIDLEIHEGNGQSPPDGQWVAWHYPGSSDPGNTGNTYVYAHAHGSPPNSAAGLFWPLHYMHNCDAVYIYTGPSAAYRYQAVSVNLHWPNYDTRPLNQTSDERVTLQTCNAWGNNDPKTIVVAMRVDVQPPPTEPHAQAAPSPAATDGGSGGPPPQQPGPVPCLVNCSPRDDRAAPRGL